MIVRVKFYSNGFISLLLAMMSLLLLACTTIAQIRPVDRQKEIPRLLSILQEEQIQEQDPARLSDAISRLGYLHAVEATDVLIKLITFKRTYEWENQSNADINEPHLVTPAGRYPAISALMRIGNPSLPALIKVIENNDQESLESNNALYTIKLIFIDNPKAGINYLEKSINQAHSVEAAYHLRIASTKFNNIEFE